MDEGISGTQTKKRTGFNAMINAAMRGEIDIILTKEVCRFARNTVDTLSYTRQLKEAHVAVIFTIDNIDTRDADGELRLTIMACIAQEESRKTSERVKWGQQRRMEQGIVFGRDMLGYRVKNGVLTVNEAEVPIVRAIFHKYANEGKGAHVIARELMEEGLYPPHSPCWSNTAILRVLRNEKYVGDLCQKKTITPDFLTHQKVKNQGEEDMIYLTEHHEPVIDRALWNRAQAELLRRSPSGETKSRYSSRYWCSGKILCGECGRNFVSHTKKMKSGACYRAWRCFENACHGRQKKDVCGNIAGCSNRSVNERTLLACAGYAVRMLTIKREKLKNEMLREIRRTAALSVPKINLKEHSTEASIETSIEPAIQTSIQTLQEKKRKTIDLMLEGLISKEDMLDQTGWYDRKIEVLMKDKAAAPERNARMLSQSSAMDACSCAMDEIMNFGENIPWLYHELLEKIIVHRSDMIDIWLKCIPFGIRLKVKTSGRLTEFRTEILETLFLSPGADSRSSPLR